MAVAHTDSSHRRAETFRRLVGRNRLVAVLRFVVPAAGLAAFLVLAGQIYISNMARQYGVSGIRIDRGNVVVETPQYSGIGTDGSRYVVTAFEARTPFERPEEINMSDATLQYFEAGGSSYFVSALDASMNTKTQIVTVPGVANVTGDDGMHGTLTALRADMNTEITTADGPVDITLSDGTSIVAGSMVHDGKASLWTFTDATVIVDDLPEAEAP